MLLSKLVLMLIVSGLSVMWVECGDLLLIAAVAAVVLYVVDM